jgi:hypothetical protein
MAEYSTSGVPSGKSYNARAFRSSTTFSLTRKRLPLVITPRVSRSRKMGFAAILN